MFKKKSFMNTKNLLTENWFKKLRNYLDFLKKHGKGMTSKEKKLMANPKLRKHYQDFWKASDKFDQTVKDLGLDKQRK
jgi:hypothetical protein